MRAGHIHVQRRRQHLVVHRLHHLDHTGHPGGGLRVTHVRLDRPQPQRFPGLDPVLAVGGQQCLGLDRIAQCRPGAVALHHVHLGRAQPGIGQRRAHHPLLGRTVGCGQPVGRAILIDRCTAHHREHPMPQPLCIRKPLHRQHPATLGPADTVGCPREGLAPAVRRQAAVPAEFDENRRRGVDGRAAGQCQIALTRPQRLHRHVQGHQRRRARGIHRHRRAFQPQHVGHPAGGHAGCHTGQPVALDLLGKHAVALGDDSGEDAGGAAPQRCWVNSGSLQRLPRQLQQHAMLRVGGQCLSRRHAEESSVEIRDVINESTRARITLVRRIGVVVKQAGQIPAPVGREFRHHVALVGDHVPQAVRRIDPAGESARHPDDRDRLTGALQQGPVLALQALDLDQRFPQRLGCMLKLISHVVTPRLTSVVAQSGMRPWNEEQSQSLYGLELLQRSACSSTREHRWRASPTAAGFPIRPILPVSIAEK